jgi:Leucine-rich repeat (LRR) protein
MFALLQSTYLKEYFNALEGIKIKNSLHFLKSSSHLFHQGIRILNISHNNISNINFILDALPNENSLEFLNINHNYFPDISSILKKCGKLKELHCQSNLITEIKEGRCPQELKIIDLSCNKLEEEKNLSAFVDVPSLIIINIFGNPMTKRSWKHEWSGSININNIYEMENLYVSLP